MLTAQEVDVVRAQWARFAETGDFDRSTLDDAVEIYDHDLPDAGPHIGQAGFASWGRTWADAWESWSMEAEEFVVVGDRLVVMHRLRAKGRGSGVELERQDAMVYEVRDGKTVRIDYFNNRDDALKFAGRLPDDRRPTSDD